MIEHFKAVFPNTIACNEEPKKENTAYAIFDPDFFGPSSMTTAEVYEKGASKTVENLDKLCMVFERKGIEEIKSKYPEVIPTKKLGTISKTKGKNCTGYIKDNTFVLGSNVDETAFLMLLDDYLKNREDKK
ncbi:MAG: hypothetical protein Q8O89_07235 [Nanoarchaeota archaeon]|nr:hypothetical protein [Nanoarchaeota archaeon]